MNQKINCKEYPMSKTLYFNVIYKMKQFLRLILCKSNLHHILRWGNRHNSLILMYHNFYKVGNDEHSNVCINIKEFEKQIIYLKKFYNIISLEKLVNHIGMGEDIPNNAVVLTFDDGYMNNYLLAYPILEKYNIHATIFLTTSYIDKEDWLWVNKLEYIISETKSNNIKINIQKCHEIQFNLNKNENKKSAYESLKNVLKLLPHNILLDVIDIIKEKLYVKVNYNKTPNYKMLTKETINRMKKKYITFGSHTNDHKILTNLSKLEYRKEIISSKKRLEKIVKDKIIYFAYPNGNYNRKIEDVVTKYYRAAVTTEGNFVNKSSNLMSLSRVSVKENFDHFIWSLVWPQT